MQDEQLLRLIRLARKTGDTLIVTDPSGAEPIVVMGVSRYEALLEDGLDTGLEDLPEELFSREEPALEVLGSEEEISYSEPTQVSVPEVPEMPEETPVSEPESSSTDEERFYLEPIE